MTCKVFLGCPYEVPVICRERGRWGYLQELNKCWAFSSPSAVALGEQYFKKSVCGFVYNAFLLCLTSFYYLNEWSDPKMVNSIFVKSAEPHQAAFWILTLMTKPYKPYDTSMQVCTFMQVCKYASMQVCKYVSI